MVMGPWDFEGDGLVVGIKPIDPNVISDGFEMFKWFPSGFNFVISFPVYLELALPAVDSVIEDFFNCP